ncbi:MAG: putative LPS assembly protein LptD, partial [Candidatus Aphodosoma sp.]
MPGKADADTTVIPQHGHQTNGLPADTLLAEQAVIPDPLVSDSMASDSLSLTTVDTDSLDTDENEEKPLLDAEVRYQARDSIVFFADGTGFLYGDGEISYLQARPIQLNAEYIRFKLDSSVIYAVGGSDSVGNPIGNPVFKEGDDAYESKYMSYNFKTRKGYVKGVVTQQDEGYIVANETKMMEDKSFFLKGGKYTTCDNHEHPHFYLHITKGKMKPGSYVAAGPAYMVMADVPLPLAVPFGFFPITKRYSSGVIVPQFGDENERGLFLKNGGYYWAINDYVDLEILGEIYTKGTWAVNLNSKYVLRYKFSGNVSLAYREDVRGEKNTKDYSKSRNFKLSWRHQQDPKASQYSSFSASVDFSTSGYNTS